MSDLAFVVPGRLDQITGGYIYDRRIVEGLRALGRSVEVIELPGRFPDADDVASRAAEDVLSRLPDGATLCIDGLALVAFEAALPDHQERLRTVLLLHHPLALETGIDETLLERFRRAELRLLRRSRGIICPSQTTAACVEDYAVPSDRIMIVPPGIDRPEPPPDVPTERQGPVRLLSVGTVTVRKGHILLIEALAEMPSHEWRLTIVGSLERDPETAAALRRTIERTKLGDRVTLAGEWPPAQLSDAYRAADLFVLASYYEGYGMVFAEAMTHGLPIIATTGGAIPDTVPVSAAMLVPPGDRIALASALDRVIGDAGLRKRFADGALAAAARLPGWQTTTRRFADALDHLSGLPQP
jgi:glycosyltransferase involved in cell wall biosynthesis